MVACKREDVKEIKPIEQEDLWIVNTIGKENLKTKRIIGFK